MIAEAVADRRSRMTRPTAPEDFEYAQEVGAKVRAARAQLKRATEPPPRKDIDPTVLVAVGLALIFLSWVLT